MKTEEKELWQIAQDAYLSHPTTAIQDWKAVVQLVITEHERRKAIEREKEADLKQAIHEFVNKPNREIPWIQWHGGECPLNDDEVGEWQFELRDGFVSSPQSVGTAPSKLRWGHCGNKGDVIAYRVLTTPVKPDPFAAEKAAFAQGKMIQLRGHATDWGWVDASGSPIPLWVTCNEHRIKPEPVWLDLCDDDIPQGAEFLVPDGVRLTLIGVGASGVMLHTGHYSFSYLRDHGYKMRPINGVFAPCRKEAV